MPVGSVFLIILAAVAMLFAAGCHGLNQYSSGDNRFQGAYSVADEQLGPPASRAEQPVQEFDDSTAAEVDDGAATDLDDAPPVVKYLPEDYPADSAQDVASDAGEIESSGDVESGSEAHLADSGKKRRR